MLRLLYTLSCCLHHSTTTRSVNIHHPNTQIGSGLNGSHDRIGNVVELEVQKDLKAPLMQRFNKMRAGCREQLLTHLDSRQLGI